MKALLVLTTVLIIFLLIIVLSLLLKIEKLNIKLKNDEQDSVWHTLALTDGLTGIYNRTAYNSHIAEFVKSNKTEGLGIVLFDIDDFKKINDTRGHLAGDEVLKMVAKTISFVFSSSRCNVYRIGGDEFAVLIRETTENEIIQLLITLRTISEKEGVKLSNGYSVIQDNADIAFENADEMLYADKTSRKHR